ncbi:MAG: hypothetical protein CSA74_12815, partial [Rhodobacterales bacterium]
MKRLAIFISPLVLLGCVAKAPDSTIGEVAGKAPGKWSATRQAKSGVDSHWVRRFGDRRLTEVVNEALRRNHDMRIAAERVKRAGEAAKLSGAASRPQVGLTTSGLDRKMRFVGFPFGGSITSETYGVDLKVGWEPDIWGRARAGKSAAIAEWQAGGQEYRAARASLAAQVCKAWFAIAEANEQVALARKALAIREKTGEAVRERFERDLRAEGGSASQLRLAQADVAAAKADLSAKRGNLETARRQLELLVGRYPAGKMSGRAGLPRVPASPPSGLPSGLLLRRPDILAAERRYASVSKRIREAQLAMFPSFKLTGSSGTTTDALGSILNSNFGVWSVGANVFYPILTGGRIRGEVRIRKSKQREALASLHKTVLNAFGEVEQALANERWLRRREGEIREARDIARDAATAAENDYRDGSGDVLTMLA